MKRKILSLITVVAMISTMFVTVVPVSAETGDSTSSIKTGDYIFFGSYPQTEIVSQASQSGVYGKNWADEGDYLVDPDLYKKLQNKDYDDNGDTTVSGVKYHRIKKSDAIYSKNECASYYNWSDSDTYHYFRYDSIRWRVLSNNGGDAFLLSEIVLDHQRYNTILLATYWENSTVRSWLNGYGGSTNISQLDYSNDNFIDRAFTEGEQDAIITTNVVNNDIEKAGAYGGIGAVGGNNTEDKIFLLSEKEMFGENAIQYGFAMSKDNNQLARVAKTSTYAKAMGVYLQDSSSISDEYVGGCNWWLRSPGTFQMLAGYVDCNGAVKDRGRNIPYATYGIRPALHLNLNKYNPENNLSVFRDSMFSLSQTTYEFDGTAKEPEVTVDGLTLGTDYTVSYEDNLEAGTATVVIEGKGDCKGRVIKYFTINPKSYEHVIFGSYPQTEIVGEASQSGSYGKNWSSYFELNPNLYLQLKDANYNENNDVTIEGVKYHRIDVDNATYNAGDPDPNYFDWGITFRPEDPTAGYRYFRYDPIYWTIIEQESNDIFLLADIALDDQKFNSSSAEVTWTASSVRNWLNGTFYNTAFNDSEKDDIKSTAVDNNTDKVFLLSKDEVCGNSAIKYGFSSKTYTEDTMRQSESGTYAKAMGAYTDDSSNSGNCCWWLRSNGTNGSNTAVYVACDGTVNAGGAQVDTATYAIRPALHLQHTHDYSNLVDEVAAACDSPGMKAHYTCKTCNMYFDSGKKETTAKDLEIPQLTHSGGTATCKNKAVCENCNKEYGEIVEHDYGDFVEGVCEIEVTADNTTRKYLCKTCGSEIQYVSDTDKVKTNNIAISSPDGKSVTMEAIVENGAIKFRIMPQNAETISGSFIVARYDAAGRFSGIGVVSPKEYISSQNAATTKLFWTTDSYIPQSAAVVIK